MLEPSKGIVTFRAEGNNIRGNPYYSRVIHWPGIARQCEARGSASGVTIGRGFDMRERSKESILHDLRISGIPFEQASKISLAARVHNCNALAFVRKYRDDIGEINEIQQLKLFNITYLKYVSNAERIYTRYKKPNSPSWSSLNERIKEIFVDMIYQGVLNVRLGDILPFERNDIESVVSFISSNRRINQYEPGRNRIRFLRDGI